MLVSSSHVARKIFSSPRTLHLERPFTERSASASRGPRLKVRTASQAQQPRPSTVFGTLSVRSWLLVFWEAWRTST